VVLISHDLGVIAQVCERVVVMYAGQVVEWAGVEDLFLRPWHPYMAGLLASIPQIGLGRMLTAILGRVPPAEAMPDWATPGFETRNVLYHYGLPSALRALRRGALRRPARARAGGYSEVRCHWVTELTWRGARRMSERERANHRRRAQMIFQDPLGLQDPRLGGGVSVAEPMLVHVGTGRVERERRAAALLDRVGLVRSVAHRPPCAASRPRDTCHRARLSDTLCLPTTA
jgi:oligopeptide/dipeptide ABC transporter ATP-binding protein